MNLIKLDFSEIMRIFLSMSISGSTVTLFLFIIKPIIKDRLPKTFQYYMWFTVLLTLILPLSKIIVLSKFSVYSFEETLVPIDNIIGRVSDTVWGIPVRLIPLSQGKIDFSIMEPQSWLPNMTTIIFFVWQFGILTFLAFHIISYIFFVRKLKECSVCASLHEIELLSKLSGEGYIPRLYVSSVIATPILVGVFHPVIVLPNKKYEDTQLKNIFLHELTHLRRYDVTVKWLSIFLEALHWFNPIIHIAQYEISKACELACDEAVIRNLDTVGKLEYSDTLLTTAVDMKKTIPLTHSMCETKRVLKERLEAIMKYRNFSKKSIALSGITLAVILLGTIYIGAGDSTVSAESEGIITYADLSAMERQKLEKSVKLKEIIDDFDKKNIFLTNVFLGDVDGEIAYANIFVVIDDKMIDSVKQEEIMLLASESLNLDSRNIHIDYMDIETFTSLEKER